MITNWYSTNIDPDYLSERLRAAYALWLSQSTAKTIPSLVQIRSSGLYGDLALYIAVVEVEGDDEHREFVFTEAGKKVVELFGIELATRRIGDVFTEAGQSLAEEIFAAMRNEKKPVLVSVSDSPIVSDDIKVIQMPVTDNDGSTELALLVYDF